MIALSEDLIALNRGRELENPLRVFTQDLTLIFQQSIAVNDLLTLINNSEIEIADRINELEESISERLIDLTFRGEDTGLMEQLAALVASYHTSLLQIGKKMAELWPFHYYQDIAPENDHILKDLDELILRCRTLGVSDPEVARLGLNLINSLQNFRKYNSDLHILMSELGRFIKKFEYSSKKIEAKLTALDRDVAFTVRTVDAKIDNRFRITGNILAILAAILVISLGFLTSFFSRKVIKEPIEKIRKGIEHFEQGDLEIRIQLDRNDEWVVIERALNSMSEKLSDSYATLRFKENIIESASSAIATAGTNGIMTYVNPSFLKAWDYENKNEIEGCSFMDFIIPDDRYEEFRIEVGNKGQWIGEMQAKRKDGSIFDIELSGSRVFDNHDIPIGIMVSCIDITERKRTLEELQQLRNLLKNIVDSMPSMLVAVDNDGRVTQWNQEVEKTTGLSAPEARRQTLEDVFPQLASEMEKVHLAIRERRPLKETKVVRQVKGETRFSDLTIYPLVSNGIEGAVIRVDDVTERVRMEELMIQSEKMLSVGGLAAGMAHEINNPLASILQNTQVVIHRISRDLPANRRAAMDCGTSLEVITNYMERRDILKMLKAVLSSGVRASQIVENMLTFSRKSDSKFLPHALSDLLDSTVELASSDYDLKKKYDFKQIKIVRNYDPKLPEVPCERTEIQQVILNLLRNAAESMMSREQRGVRSQIILSTIKERDMARIEVEDNGPGMGEDIRRRIFEPFFTTKELGAGTGLGLSVSYFIITENHRGSMEVESTLGIGSKFIIRLPLQV